MSKIAIFPFKLRGTIPFGFSGGWYFKDDTGEFCMVFMNFKTREQGNEAIKKEMPDVEIVNLDYQPPSKYDKED